MAEPADENDLNFAPGDEKKETSDLFDGFERARPHHYVFAYNVLPQFVYWDPLKFQQAAMQNEMPKILRHLWDKIGTEFPPEERLPSEEFSCLVDEFDGMTRIVVVMPQTERTMEAVMIGIVMSIQKPGGITNLLKKVEPEVHIFSLERSYPEDGAARNMIGVFSREKGRVGNLGEGPQDADSFKLWLEQHIRESR